MLTQKEIIDIVYGETDPYWGRFQSWYLDNCSKWRYQPRYPVKIFTERPFRIELAIDEVHTKKSWEEFWQQEMDPGMSMRWPSELRELKKDWLADPTAFTPIVVVEFEDGSIDIGDGWHRVAISVLADKHTIPAIVGSCPYFRWRDKLTERESTDIWRATGDRISDDDYDRFMGWVYEKLEKGEEPARLEDLLKRVPALVTRFLKIH